MLHKRPGESAEEEREKKSDVCRKQQRDAGCATQDDAGNQCILSFVIKLLHDNAVSGEMNF